MSLTVPDTRTSSPFARPLRRAPMWTAKPPMSSPISSHSPVWIPARISRSSSASAVRTAFAQRTAAPRHRRVAGQESEDESDLHKEQEDNSVGASSYVCGLRQNGAHRNYA